MAIKVSVSYNDQRWKRFNLARYITLLLSKVAQIHQIRLNNFSLSVLACGDVKIKELYKEYRKKNKATNVLAWPAMHNLFYLDQDYLSYGKNNYLFLGDIAISYERCLREASSQNVQFNYWDHFLEKNNLGAVQGAPKVRNVFFCKNINDPSGLVCE